MANPPPAVLPTAFLPAERAPAEKVAHDVQDLRSTEWLGRLYAAVFDAVLILNEYRQIIFCNPMFLRILNASGAEQIYGLRPGEALKCIHAERNPGGCGTSEFCRECGAAEAVFQAQAGRDNVQECRLTQRDGEALEIQVRAAPIEIGGRRCTSFAARDISSEKRRRLLERLFFHDVLNTAVTVRSASELAAEDLGSDRQSYLRMILCAANRLVEQIQSQRDLAAAESGDLAPNWAEIDVQALIEEVAESYRSHESAAGKKIAVTPAPSAIALCSDRTLLARVLENMTKNALEACAPGSTVTLAAAAGAGRVVFSVHNPECMPPAVQHQVFQRSFSTKGQGRGIGTYSIKLLSERYLQGRVAFASAPNEGTTFFADYPLRPADR